MPSTFFGLNIASSAMNAFQAAVNTTANNISNVHTEGYSKQVANRQASEGLRVYQKFGMAGTGVTTESITSLRSVYYDTKYWNNQASVGNYNTKLTYLNQIENYFIDDGETQPGFSTIFANMFNQMNALTSDAGNVDRRKNFVSETQSFASYFHDVAADLQDLQKDCNEQISSLVQRLNASTQKIASLTKQINTIELENGMRANELRDQRALIIDQISEIVPVSVEESPITNSNYPDMYLGGTNYIVKLDGQTLINNYDYKTLTCVPRENKVNQTDAEGLYDIVWSDTGMKFNVNAKSMNGSLRALFDVRDGNHAENFQGDVISATNRFIKIKPSTMTSVESMTMAAEGVITIKNKEYYYSGFTAELDENGKVISYTFEMEQSMETSVAAAVIGKGAQIGASVDAMGIPYYMAQMSEFLRCFSGRFNAYQKGAMDLNEDEMGAFFVATGFDGTEYSFNQHTVGKDGVTSQDSVISSSSDCYYQLTAFSFNVADAIIRDPSKFATSMDVTGDKVDAHEVIDEMLKLQSDIKLFRGGSASDFLHCIYTDISVDTNEAEIFQKNFNDIASAITTQRLSVSGVDEDEEALDIVKFQNAYNLASRMVQCMSEMYDKLIQETGV